MIRLVKRFISILPLIMVILLLTGCWHILQPEDLAMISLVGFDKEDDEYIITMHILNPDGISTGSTGSAGSDEDPVRVLMTRGQTITDAIHEANRYNPGHHFWGHLSGIVIGESMAREGIATLMDALGRSNEVMETANLYIARDMTAEELLRATTKEKLFPADALRKISTYTSMHTASREIRLNQALQTISTNPGTLIMPGVRTGDPKKPSSRQGETFHLTGMAVLSNWKLKGWLDGEEAMGYMWFMEQMEHHGFNVPFKTGILSVETLPNQTSIHVEVDQDKIKQVTVKVKGTVRVSEWKNISIETNKDLLGTEKSLREVINQEVKKIMEQTVERTQELHADILQLNEHVRMASPDLWEKISNDWEQNVFPEVPIRIEVDVSIRDIGELYRTITE